MKDFQFTLLENATDSFNEALVQYQRAKDEDPAAYKHCISYLSHFFELILKYYVTQSHPLLLFKNPFAKKIDENSYTIGLNEAINFLMNEGREFPKEFLDDLEWLKKLRNNIEHHKFSMNVEEAKETVGRLVHAFNIFDAKNEKLELEKFISEENTELFEELAKTYEFRLREALAKVEAAEEKACAGYRPKEYELVNFAVYSCDNCGHETVIPDEESSSGYKCTFCGEEECDYAEYPCEMCGLNWPKYDLSYLDWADTGQFASYCPVCLRHPDYVKDD